MVLNFFFFLIKYKKFLQINCRSMFYMSVVGDTKMGKKA